MAKKFDPIKYIEDAFLDAPEKATKQRERTTSDSKTKFRKTAMKAPRPRKNAQQKDPKQLRPELKDLWKSLPKNFEFLLTYYDDGVTTNYYNGSFKESREDLIVRLMDPQLNLEEVSRLLGVCPATVRRYTNKGWLEHMRTPGGQRRFRLSHVVKFVDQHGRFPTLAKDSKALA